MPNFNEAMKAQRRLDDRLDDLLARGFDASYITENRDGIRPRCSACETLVINGITCHEIGCPNALHECRGCNALIPTQARYCEDCQ